MTTLAGLHLPGQGTWIGADQMISIGELRTGPRTKWIQRGAWAVGVAGDARTLDLIEEAAELVLEIRGPRDFAHRMAKVMLEAGYTAATDGPFGPPCFGQEFLLASPEGLWDLDIALTVQRVPDNTLWAAGSGRDFALGAGIATAALLGEPEARVRAALEAAAAYDSMTGHGFFLGHLAPGLGANVAPKKRMSRVVKS